MSKMQYYWMMTDGGRKRQNDIIVRPRVRVEDPYILYDGVLINNWEDDMLFEYSPKEGHIITEYLGNVYGWDIFSEKAINLLGDLITNDVQLLPIKVVNNDTGLEIDKYFVVNVLRFLDALDLKNADHYYSGDGEEKELSVIKYAIKEEKAAGHHIFRLKESKFALFVSEDFYRTVQKNKIVGCYFSKVYTS